MSRPQAPAMRQAAASVIVGILTRAEAMQRYSVSRSGLSRAIKRAGAPPLAVGRPKRAK
jgi:hypothetical protein